MTEQSVLFGISRTLIVAPLGPKNIHMVHSAHNCVAALEKGKIICELRLAVKRMTNSHWQRLKIAAHKSGVFDAKP